MRMQLVRPLLTSFAATRSRCIMSGKAERFSAADFPGTWPYTEQDFERMDTSADILFYSAPRFVTHVDDGAIASITRYYRDVLPENADLLDICSSWVSHLPPELPLGRVVGLGMNARELEANKRLTEFVQADLNASPKLPFDDDSFDVCCNVVSVDYLCRPKEVFEEMHRVLRPGGQAIMSFSNRCFPTKAVAMWLNSGDAGRRKIIASYFALAPASGWTDITALDITGIGTTKAAAKPGINPLLLAALWLKQSIGDPMFVVRATKAKSNNP